MLNWLIIIINVDWKRNRNHLQNLRTFELNWLSKQNQPSFYYSDRKSEFRKKFSFRTYCRIWLFAERIRNSYKKTSYNTKNSRQVYTSKFCIYRRNRQNFYCSTRAIFDKKNARSSSNLTWSFQSTSCSENSV